MQLAFAASRIRMKINRNFLSLTRCDRFEVDKMWRILVDSVNHCPLGIPIDEQLAITPECKIMVHDGSNQHPTNADAGATIDWMLPALDQRWITAGAAPAVCGL